MYTSQGIMQTLDDVTQPVNFEETGETGKIIGYVGQFENGQYHGQGQYRHPSGAIYTGGWNRGKRHGSGTYESVDGSSYVGEWENNVRNGEGMYKGVNGASYVGQFKGSQWHGKGVYTDRSGNVFPGVWEKHIKVSSQDDDAWEDLITMQFWASMGL